MEVIHEIKYDGKTFTVHEPTIDIWQELMVKQEFTDDFQLAITILSWVTGLSIEEMREADTRSIINAADGIVEYFTTQSEQFVESFTFIDKTYKFIDLPNITFGEYIDIDDVLQKPTVERYRSLALLMALLYREVDDKGNYLPYDPNKIKKTAELFRKLPIKYVKGSTVFFYLMETTLKENTQFSILQKEFWMLRRRMLKRRVTRLVGIVQSISWLKKISSTLKKWLS